MDEYENLINLSISGGTRDTVTIDKQEYEALINTVSDQGKKITALENSINNIIGKKDYSTTEQIVGKWIDGKDIYRKVLNFSSISAGATIYVPVGAEVEKFVNVNGKLIDGKDSSIINILPSAHTGSVNNQYSIVCYTHSSTSHADSIRIMAGSGVLSSGGFLIVEYTKINPAS